MRLAKGRNFPQGRRSLRLVCEQAPDPAATVPGPTSAADPRPPLVLAGCFRGLPEQDYFANLMVSGARLACLTGRSEVLLAATLLQPRLVVLPSADAQGVSMRSIARTCLSLAPGRMGVLMLLSLAPGLRRSPGAYAGLNVEVAIARSAAELAEIVAAILGPNTKPRLRLA